MDNEIVIIGLGNLYMRDEGVGGRIVQALVDRREVPEGVEALDLGTGGLAVLHAISGRRKAVLVDCAFMDELPGVWRRFRPDEVRSRKLSMRYSLHEGDLMETLELAARVGECPADVCVIGIQPESIEPGEGLSPALENRFEEYMRVVAEAARGDEKNVRAMRRRSEARNISAWA